jgi:DNA polymerase-3 subunit psi
MASRRDWLLTQLGITQWVLRRPAVLQGEVALSIAENIRLLIVAARLPDVAEPLIQDVLRCLGLDDEQVSFLTPEQTVMLPASTACHCWRLGIASPVALQGVQLSSPSLAELYQNAGAKRALWQQICENEHYFSLNTRGSTEGITN